MADEKLNTGPEVQKTEEAPAPAVADPAHGEAAVPEHPPEQAGPADPGDVVISAEQIDALMAEKRQAARAEVEKAEASREQEAGAPAPEHPAVESEKAEKPRRGRPPKSDKTERPGPEAEKEPKKAGPRKGRPSKADKAAPDKAQPSQRDKLSRSGGKAPEAPAPPDAGKDKPAKEAAPPEQGVTEPTVPPRPVEEGKLVYLKLSDLHPFHTFRPHPFKVRDDAKMQETVASIKLNGVMVPGLARPEKDGNGYEIVAGHRRCRGSELAGLEEMPFIVRDMTDHEAVEAMKDSMEHFSENMEKMEQIKEKEYVERNQILIEQLLKDLSKNPGSKEIQDIIDQMMNLLDEEDKPDMDLGENYWDVMIDSYLHNSALIENMDKKYGKGASVFMGKALSCYMETSGKCHRKTREL